MSTDWLKIILAVAPKARREIARGLAYAMPEIVSKYGVKTPLDQAHFLAQTAHESDGFQTTVEYATGDAYDTRTDLGFTKAKDGDGRKFKGFGLIQETGPNNQREVATDLGILAEWKKDPRILAAFPWAALSAGHYWKSRHISALANRDDVEAVTRRINGGLNGLADRKTYLRRAKAALGVGAPLANAIVDVLAEADPMPRAKVKLLQAALSPVYPLGAPDGKIGTLTVAAISAFQADCGLPVSGCFDPATVDLIERGVGPRPLPVERLTGKPHGSRILKGARRLQAGALTLCAPAALKLADDPLSTLEGVSDYWNRGKALLEPFGGLAGAVTTHWPVAVLAVGVAVFVVARKIAAAKVEDYRTGKAP